MNTILGIRSRVRLSGDALWTPTRNFLPRDRQASYSRLPALNPPVLSTSSISRKSSSIGRVPWRGCFAKCPLVASTHCLRERLRNGGHEAALSGSVYSDECALGVAWSALRSSGPLPDRCCGVRLTIGWSGLWNDDNEEDGCASLPRGSILLCEAAKALA